MPNLTVRLIGNDIVARMLQQYAKDAPDAIRGVVYETAAGVREEARRLVPVDTGNLRDSIEIRQIDDRQERISAMVGTDVEYAAYVEFGTRRMPAKPYLTPAAELEFARVPARVVEALEQPSKYTGGAMFDS